MEVRKRFDEVEWNKSLLVYRFLIFDFIVGWKAY